MSLLTRLCMTIRQVGTEGQRKGNHLRCREKQDVQTWSQTTQTFQRTEPRLEEMYFKKAGIKPTKPRKKEASEMLEDQQDEEEPIKAQGQTTSTVN